MLKLCELKNHLHEHIVLLVVSITFLISGCAGLGGGKSNQVQEAFYPEYYAAKRIDHTDTIALRNFMASTDNKISDPATLILGINYLRHGDKNFGRMLIDKSYNSKFLDNEMVIFGKLWKMESLLTENKIEEAENYRKEIKSWDKSDPLFIRAMKIYCISIGRSLLPNEDITVCVDERFSAPDKEILFTQNAKLPEFDKEKNPNPNSMTYEEYVEAIGGEEKHTISATFDEKAEIDIIGSDVMSEMVQGMIFAISNLNSSFIINSVADENERKNAVAVYVDKGIVSIGENNTSMNIDWENFVDIATKIEGLNHYKNIAICADNTKISYAKMLQEKYGTKGKNIKVFNYNNSAFQGQLRAYLEKLKYIEMVDDKEVEKYNPTLIIGLGNEKDITNFITVARFLQNSKEQKILLMLNSLTPATLKTEYAQYFKDVTVLTPLGMINDTKYFEVNPAFEVFFGKEMEFMNILGYDTIVFLLTQLHPEIGSKFVSAKEGFIDGKAYRSINMYEINKELKAIQKEYKIIDNIEEDIYGIGQDIEEVELVE